MGKVRNVLNGMKPLLVMIVVQTTFAGVDIFYKLAANDAMNLSILIAYRHIFAAAIMLPVALLVERMEKLGLSEGPGKAKVVGTLMCMIGAMLLTFYKGPYINILNPNFHLAKNTTQHQVVHVEGSNSVRILGAILATGGSFCYALWLVFQAKINELYPCPYSSVALMNVMASIQSTVFALLTERDWNQWKLGFNIRLLTAIFNGMVGAGLIFTLTAWCVKMRGPVFASAFNPLTLVLVAVAEFLLLDEKLHLGSFLGSFIIVCGLYLVLWGKDKEIKRNANAELLPEKTEATKSTLAVKHKIIDQRPQDF